jgi:hypothetical protein
LGSLVGLVDCIKGLFFFLSVFFSIWLGVGARSGLYLFSGFSLNLFSKMLKPIHGSRDLRHLPSDVLKINLMKILKTNTGLHSIVLVPRAAREEGGRGKDCV